MEDIYDIVKNVERIYNNTTHFTVLKDFERVLDELGLYVYDNWDKGELASGPIIEKHWVTCKFFWPRNEMPDPDAGKRLLHYDCKITYQKTELIKPIKIRKQSDIRPGTKKGKLQRQPIWIVSIMMPKKLLADIYKGYKEKVDWETDPAKETTQNAQPQAADQLATPPGAAPAVEPAAAAGQPDLGGGLLQ
jgi:hypothetical protein